MIDKTQLNGWIREYCQFLNREMPDWMENNPKKFREILKTVKETQEYTRVRDAIKLLHSGRNLLRFHLKDESSLKRIWDEFLKEIVETEPEKLLQNIDERFEKWKKIEGIGRGLITEALSFYYPKYFAPWNNTVEWYFEKFGWERPNAYSTVLNHLNEFRELFKEVCEDDPDFIMVDHFGWWLKHQLSAQGFEELIELLRREKEKFSAEWQKEGLPVINEMRNIVDEFVAFKLPDLEPPFPINNKDVEKLLWFIKGGVSSEVDLEKVREYIIELTETDKSNSKTVIEKYWKKIPGVGPTGMITIAALVYPDTFMPLWGSPKDSRGVINSKTFRLLGVDKNAYRLGLNEYLSVIERVRSAAVNVGIDNLFEAAFYLIKYGGEEMPQTKTSGSGLVEYLHSKGYSFPNHLIAQFYVALKTKGFVILSGLTGTGKTKIAQELAELLGNGDKNYIFLSVRPDWRDSKPLLGYYNPLTEEYHKTPLLELILRAKENYEQNREKAMPYLIILDEMNLAHVEYYFADFLSILESGRDESGFTRENIKLHNVDKVVEEQGIPKEIKLPPNLYIIGTVNIDETTYMFSPKVLDRAFTIEFHDVELEEYPPEKTELLPKELEKLRNAILNDLRRDGNFLAISKKGKDKQEGDIEKALKELKDANNGKYWQILQQLNKALAPYDLHFGYRVVDEIALFMKNAKESRDKKIVEFENDNEIFDLALLMKVLPKFHGNRKRLERPLKKVLEMCIEKEFDVKFEENNNERTIKSPQNIEELNSRAIIEMLTNWKKYESNFHFKYTAKKVLRMLRQLYEIGFASFS